MKIGLVQFAPVWEEKEENKKKLRELILTDTTQPTLYIFPEMTLTGFTMEPESFAESLQGESYHYFYEIARTKTASVIAGIIEEEKGKYFNTLIHIDPFGNILASYRKIHPFTLSNEHMHYNRGNKPIITRIGEWRTGLSVCYDLRFPELYRLYAKSKVELIINIANWPDSRINHWLTLLNARAIENMCFVIGVNRVGRDPKLNYPGGSSIFDPSGNEIVSVFDEERIIAAELDFETVSEVRAALPFLSDIKLI